MYLQQNWINLYSSKEDIKWRYATKYLRRSVW